ncbi:hypothetical protein phi16_gp087 [Corynebacterium phage phi16]|uniref:hypothetical protein n=1 Tax=Corynebacterium glutamicum TaxID=1718 RepID=UPI00097E3EC1|nr:hypothetical protein [Corynebacterium glutamicum]APQ42590.1 hypothetical protein phi16_gp087 [Corynebacterium phage phi16]
MSEPVMTPQIPDNLSAVVWAQKDGRVGIFMRPETSDKHATMAFAQAMQLLHQERKGNE